MYSVASANVLEVSRVAAKCELLDCKKFTKIRFIQNIVYLVADYKKNNRKDILSSIKIEKRKVLTREL